MRPKATILFGEMGSGKSYLGKRLATLRNVPFLEGDDLLPRAARARVEKFLPMSRGMVDAFVEDLIDSITSRRNREFIDGVVVAQALYGNAHRKRVKEALEAAGFEVEMLYVSVSFFQNMRQLWTRRRALSWVLYWFFNHLFFQKPTHIHVPIKTQRALELFATWSK